MSTLPQLRHYLQHGALDEVELLLSQALTDQPETAELWLIQGQLYQRQQRLAEALSAWEYALCLQPDLHAAHASLAQYYREYGQSQLALKHLSAARAFAPENSPEQSHYTQALLEVSLDSGELQAASLYLKEWLQQAPETPESYGLCGRVMAAIGQNQAAEAALLQSLQLAPEQISVHLDLIRFYLTHRAWQHAAQALVQLEPYLQQRYLSSDTAASIAKLRAQSAFWQGDLPAAREHWRTALANQFDVGTLASLCLGMPLVSQSEPEWIQWHAVLREGLAILQQQAPPPPELIPWEQIPAPWQTEARQALGSWLETGRPLYLSAQPKASGQKCHIGFMVDDLQRPGLPESLSLLLAHWPADSLITVFYCQASEIPSELSPWAATFQPLPQLAPALTEQLLQAQLDILAYWDLPPLFYAAAVAQPASLQVLMPGAARWTSGLQRMHCVLSAASDRAYWQQQSEKPLTIELLRFPLSAVKPAQTIPSTLRRNLRQSLGLPRLNRVYGLLAPPQDWLPEIDAVLKALLEAEPRALLVGLQLPGSVLHTHLQQRHAEHLGAFAGRLRWLPGHTSLSQLIAVLDGLVELPWSADGWRTQQALQAGVPVLTWRHNAPQAAAAWLDAAHLPVSESAQALVKSFGQSWNADRPDPQHDMLNTAEMAQTIYQEIYTEWLQRIS